MQFNMKFILIFVGSIAVSLAAMSSSNRWIAMAALNITILLLVGSVIGSLVAHRKQKYFGFAVAASSYFVIVTFQLVPPEKLITTHVVAQMSNHLLPGDNSDRIHRIKLKYWSDEERAFHDIVDDIDKATGKYVTPKISDEDVLSYLEIAHCSITILFGMLGGFIAMILSKLRPSRETIQEPKRQ